MNIGTVVSTELVNTVLPLVKDTSSSTLPVSFQDYQRSVPNPPLLVYPVSGILLNTLLGAIIVYIHLLALLLPPLNSSSLTG